MVEWRETKTRQNYRIGYQGKVRGVYVDILYVRCVFSIVGIAFVYLINICKYVYKLY